jgi:hypothetical protein
MKYFNFFIRTDAKLSLDMIEVIVDMSHAAQGNRNCKIIYCCVVNRGWDSNLTVWSVRYIPWAMERAYLRSRNISEVLSRIMTI